MGENSEAEGNTVDFPSVPGSQESDFQFKLVVPWGFADEKPTQLCGEYIVNHSKPWNKDPYETTSTV